MPKVIFTNTEYKGEISLNKANLDYLKKNNIKSVALFASAQFLNLDKLKNQLKKEKIKVNITKAKRASEQIQILGCNISLDNFQQNIIKDSDAVLYIGDGMFHPKALLLAQAYNKQTKPLIIYNPLTRTTKTLKQDEIQKNIQKLKTNLKAFILAKKIGIIVTTKTGQQYLNLAQKLKAQLKKQGKKPLIFIDDKINIQELENFPFINAWVNTACPRIATDDAINISKPIINIREAFNPTKYLDKLNN